MAGSYLGAQCAAAEADCQTDASVLQRERHVVVPVSCPNETDSVT